MKRVDQEGNVVFSTLNANQLNRREDWTRQIDMTVRKRFTQTRPDSGLTGLPAFRAGYQAVIDKKMTAGQFLQYLTGISAATWDAVPKARDGAMLAIDFRLNVVGTERLPDETRLNKDQ